MSDSLKITDPQNLYLQSPKAFHLEMPLYTEFDLETEGIAEKVYRCISYSGTIDAYCIWCEKESVFDTTENIHETPFPGESGVEAWQSRVSGFRKVQHTCTRDRRHKYHAFYFKVENIFIKMGQLPSAADFQIPKAEKYRKILGEQQYKELVRGIGLVAHGVGIGSFVYLRRVFENLIDEAHGKALSEKDFPDDEYRNAKMDRKIEMLKDHLPEFLVENRSLYSVLSKGIHDLDEEECLKYFESVRIGIEQILDEKIEKKEKVAKAVKARAAVQKISGELGSSGTKKST